MKSELDSPDVDVERGSVQREEAPAGGGAEPPAIGNSQSFGIFCACKPCLPADDMVRARARVAQLLAEKRELERQLEEAERQLEAVVEEEGAGALQSVEAKPEASEMAAAGIALPEVAVAVPARGEHVDEAKTVIYCV